MKYGLSSDAPHTVLHEYFTTKLSLNQAIFEKYVKKQAEIFHLFMYFDLFTKILGNFRAKSLKIRYELVVGSW
jgi:hypothetical protein